MFSIIHMSVFLSIHDTLSTLLQHHNSKASIFLLSCFLIVQDIASYSTIGNIKTVTSFTFVSSVTPLSFHIDVSPPIADFPIAILLRISFSRSPSLVISAPTKTNLINTYYLYILPIDCHLSDVSSSHHLRLPYIQV